MRSSLLARSALVPLFSLICHSMFLPSRLHRRFISNQFFYCLNHLFWTSATAPARALEAAAGPAPGHEGGPAEARGPAPRAPQVPTAGGYTAGTEATFQLVQQCVKSILDFFLAPGPPIIS